MRTTAPPRIHIRSAALPEHALLHAYTRQGAYTDCYAAQIDRSVSLEAYMHAFYTTPLFKLERALLQRFAHAPSTDREARELAHGQRNRFAIWRLETRQAQQAILAAWNTRSWFMICPHPDEIRQHTTLFFGSAVLPNRVGALAWPYTALRGFHILYSRLLLRAACRALLNSH